MGTQVTLVYTMTPLGLTAAQLAALVDKVAVPLPKDELELMLGLRIISDTTVNGPPVVRTVVLGFDPTAPATVAAITLAQGGAIEAVTANPGIDYILPPLVKVVYPAGSSAPVGKPPLLKALMNAQATAMDANGGGYVAPIVTFIGGLPPANLLGSLSVPDDNGPKPPPKVGCVRKIFVKDTGLRYPIGTVAQIVGGGTLTSSPAIAATADVVLDAFGRVIAINLTDMGAGYVKRPQVNLVPPVGFVPPAGFKAAKAIAVMAEGTPARAGVITLGGGGSITNIALAVGGNGDGYVSIPTILIRDSAGSGAVAHARMGVGRVDVIGRSTGVPATATVAFTSVFQNYVPSTVVGNDPNQQRPFFRFIEAALMQNGITPVVSTDPLVA